MKNAMLRLSIPNFIRVGLLAALFIVALALGLSAQFKPQIYESWVAFVGLTVVPAQLVLALLWKYQNPKVLARLSQPAKGFGFVAITMIAMALLGAFQFWVPGHGAGPTPMLINACIMTVVAAFWVVAVWETWPLSLFIKNPVLIGIAAWVFSGVVGYGCYEDFFNFAFARHAPFYTVALDPRGLFDAWDALVFAVTTSGIIVVLEKIFHWWPLESSPRSLPLRGAGRTVLVLLTSLILRMFFVDLLHFGLVDFMVRVPIAMIFGVFLVTNLTQSKLFASTLQPRKGWLLLGPVLVLGAAMEEFYRFLAPILVGWPLLPGPPEFALELWVATALLSVTFPLIILVTGYFDLWPFQRRGAAAK